MKTFIAFAVVLFAVVIAEKSNAWTDGYGAEHTYVAPPSSSSTIEAQCGPIAHDSKGKLKIKVWPNASDPAVNPDNVEAFYTCALLENGQGASLNEGRFTGSKEVYCNVPFCRDIVNGRKHFER